MNYLFHDYFSTQGPFFKEDSNGNLVPPISSVEKIPVYNRAILSEVIKICSDHLMENLLAIYFRGSRLLDAYTSDFDTVLITKTEVTEDIGRLFKDKLSNRFLNISYYDTMPISIDELQNNRSLQFVVKVLSVRVYGDALETQIKHFKIDKELIFFIPKLNSKISFVEEIFDGKPDQEEMQIIVNYAVKFALRAAFELVIERSRKYTRDITVCNELFMQYYPQYSDYSREIHGYYNNHIAPAEARKFLKKLSTFCALIQNEYLALYENISNQTKTQN